MKRYLQYEPFNIYSFEAKDWQHPVHNHNHFELIFIRSGKGKHVINSNIFPYTTGDVFLLGPEDHHYFVIDTTTQFSFIRFMEVFVKEENFDKLSGWQHTLSFLLNAPYQSFGSIVKSIEEKEILDHLLRVLLHEYNNRTDFSYEVIMPSIMKATLSVLARNIIQRTNGKGNTLKVARPIENMMVYIRQNILRPEALRIETFSERFNYSTNYLSTYFKKHTGESLQQYILKYKLKLIENRLLYSELSISEISHEFGFSDESHLNKTFRKYYGLPPGAYRNQFQEQKNQAD